MSTREQLAIAAAVRSVVWDSRGILCEFGKSYLADLFIAEFIFLWQHASYDFVACFKVYYAVTKK